MAQIAIRRETSQDSVDREITGVPTYSKIIDIIDSRLGSSEFYEIVPARVLKVYSEEADLPIVTVKDEKKPVWSLLYSIDVEVIEDGRVINNIHPLSINFIQLPVVDEVVNLTAHAGTIYYSAPVNSENNITANIKGLYSLDDLDLKVFRNKNAHNRKSYSHHGDTILQGKFGQHITFSGYPDDTGQYVSPLILIGSNQFNDKNQLTYKDGDIHMPHIHNINSFGSAIEISSGNYMTPIEPAFTDFENLLKPIKGTLGGDQIVVNSDRIIINAKRDTIRNTQSGDIHFFAGRNVNIGATEEINLEITPGDNTSKITLADANSVNPLVKGNELLLMMESLIVKVIKFTNVLTDLGDPKEDFEAVSKKTLGPAAKDLIADLQTLRGEFLTPTDTNRVGKIFSNKIYIG